MHMPDKEGSPIVYEGTTLVTAYKHCQRRTSADCFEERQFCCGKCTGIARGMASFLK